MPQVSPADLPDDALVLDVREQDEWDEGHAPQAVHIPLSQLVERLGELPHVDGTLPVTCKAGGRSAQAVTWLAQQGYDVANVDGGMMAWAAASKPMVADGGSAPRVK
ncbi:MAG: rhodanese-like domain-containing protein [Actinomycetota bacterium]|nr:rhodanese-like domain-containing protein [Actinomycetota bacterium]